MNWKLRLWILWYIEMLCIDCVCQSLPSIDVLCMQCASCWWRYSIWIENNRVLHVCLSHYVRFLFLFMLVSTLLLVLVVSVFQLHQIWFRTVFIVWLICYSVCCFIFLNFSILLLLFDVFDGVAAVLL